jgi:hypothetical protein
MKRSFSAAALLGLGMLASAAPMRAHGYPEGFSMSVWVDGTPLPEFASRGRIYVEALKGREFTIRLTNPTSGRIAVALSVDGRNVVDARRTSEKDAVKWVLDPGQTVEIPGWQISGETARRFFFTETSRSYAKWLGDTVNVGTIEAVFFRERVRPRPLAAAPRDSERGAANEPPPQSAEQKVEGGVEGGVPGGVMGGIASSPLAAPAPSAPRQKAADSFAATGIGDRTSFSVQWVDFQADPSPAARIAIRYEFRPELVRLGVLPRPDDGLFAREHARGFEHAYAPDPDAHR